MLVYTYIRFIIVCMHFFFIFYKFYFLPLKVYAIRETRVYCGLRAELKKCVF
jgi:hypothetical protein